MANLKRAFQRMKLLASFSRILRSDDSGALQIFQIEGLIGEIREGVDRIGEWGLASHPPDGTQAVVIALGGSRGSLVIIGTEDRATRPKDLPKGSSELYSSDAGTRVRVNADGTIVVDASGDVTVNAGGDAEVNATVEARVTAAKVRLGALSEIDGLTFGTHFHADPVSGVTGPAQGVPLP